MATFSSAECAILYDSSENTEGGLSTGIGYDAMTKDGDSKTVGAIGAPSFVVKCHSPYGDGTIVNQKGDFILTDDKDEIVTRRV